MTSNNFVAALREFHWQVSACESPTELLDRLRTQDVDAMVLRGQGKQVPQLIAALRRAAPDAVVVWQAPAASARERVEALEAGVDAYSSVRMDAREWDALLRNARRRLLPPATDGPAWRVHGGERVLSGPGGERLPLTVTERAFLLRLLNAPGQCLRRERFFPSDPQEGARSVDVLVSRLRSKARRFDIDLPVLAVRGWGYILLQHYPVTEQQG
ncbi:winged helix-turn-helix domain-containing protein [Achromobacter sp. UMC46]|uniref:winged helix-turn-helix domain-containing protein n=1 Tax=Achromobacter sp. UMC46 TaxID=1862319 RepID=UPI002107CBC6|nr:winged helix-turn-helix domain-containing protein [Achromobacter sp. UMC46]